MLTYTTRNLKRKWKCRPARGWSIFWPSSVHGQNNTNKKSENLIKNTLRKHYKNIQVTRNEKQYSLIIVNCPRNISKYKYADYNLNYQRASQYWVQIVLSFLKHQAKWVKCYFRFYLNFSKSLFSYCRIRILVADNLSKTCTSSTYCDHMFWKFSLMHCTLDYPNFSMN